MTRRKICRAAAGIAVVIVTVIPSGAAAAGNSAAITLNGDWAAFTRCPVDAAAMLAADGVRRSDECLASNSPSGIVKLGNTTATTGDSNLQLGVLATGSGTTTAVAPSGGAIAAAPVPIPGGLLGLMCPSSILLVTLLCDAITNNTLNHVTATIEPAGSPSHLNLAGGTTTGQPVVRIPVKVQLNNPLLGSNCFIGSNSDPIVLRPETTVVPPNARAGSFDPNGTPDPTGPLLLFTLSGGRLADNTFSVPGANGCGPLGIADPAIDLKEGLPSPAGNNRLVLNHVTISLAGYGNPASVAPHEGRALSRGWHSAVRG